MHSQILLCAKYKKGMRGAGTCWIQGRQRDLAGQRVSATMQSICGRYR
jgi:hypothetical protein